MASNRASASSTTSSSLSAVGRSSRGSIHTPLSPASVQDLKAKFDPGKSAADSSTGSDSKVTSVQRNSHLKTNSLLSVNTSNSSTGSHSKVTTVQRNSQLKSSSTLSERKVPVGSSLNKDVSSLSSSSKSSSSVTLSAVSSSLQSAAQKKIGSASSTSFSSSSSSSNLRPTSKSSGVSSARTFSPPALSSSRNGSASSSDRSSPSLDNSSKIITSTSSSSTSSKWEPKSVTKHTSISNTTSTNRPNSTANASSTDIKNIFVRNKDGHLDLPLMQISSSGLEVSVQTRLKGPAGTSNSEISAATRPKSSTMENKLETISGTRSRCFTEGTKARDIHEKKPDIGTSYISKKIDSNSSSAVKPSLTTEHSLSKENGTSVQKSNKLVAREIKIERLDSGVSVTSYKHNDAPTSTTSAAKAGANAVGVRSKTKEAKTGKVTAEQSSNSNSKNTKAHAEFLQVKLRKTKSEQSEDATKPSSPRGNVKASSSDADDKRVSRKISSERFDRLMFDFQRGVPTETIIKRESETDHITLQQKARELSKPVAEDAVPVIAKKKKEPSIFTEGLKVSDFVKQVNKLNPETEAQPKWKAQRAQSQTSSEASSEMGGDNFYQGIPGEDTGNISDDSDDIYEKVANRAASSTEGDISKAPGRRLGVYSQMKNLTNYAFKKLQMKNLTNYAFKKLRQRGSKKRLQKNTAGRSETVSDGEERVIQSEKSSCDNGESSSSGTDYEDVSTDGTDLTAEGGVCLYEDLENFTKTTNETTKNKTIKHKLKKMFQKSGGKSKKNKPFIDSGVFAGTESEADTIDDTEEADSDLTENFSRTSSERSSSHRSRDSNAVGNISASASAATAASNIDEISAAESAGNQSVATSSMHPPPPLPPRTTKLLNQPMENSPPLPPRNQTLPNKAALGNSQDSSMPISPTGKSSGRASDKTKDILATGGNSLDVCDSGTVTSGKIEILEHDPVSPLPLEKPERSDFTSRKRKSIFSRKTGSTSQPGTATSTGSSFSASYVYPDISAFPELKGDDVNLYVDLEDVQIYGKASDFYVSKFESEPLYQWYSKDKVIQNMSSDKSTSEDLSSDDEYLEERRRPESVYEDVEKLLEKANSSITVTKSAMSSGGKTAGNRASTTLGQISAKDLPHRRSVIEDVFKNGGSLHRALWCQMPEVIESGLLSKLTDHEKKIQEATFEIITSEASYLKSLKVVISVFLMAPEFSSEMSDRCVISRRDRQILFSNIGHIRDISEEFLKDLEARWMESCYISDICDIIDKHASQKFEPYVRYCGNQAFQDKALSVLRQNSDFTEAVRKLEQHPDCQFLPLASFLLLPMQRITRMPLLVDAICHRLDPSNPAHASAKKAMDSLTKVAKRCDEAAKKMQQTEQICMLKSNLEFKIKEFPLISASRFLVKQGELTQVKVEGAGRKPLSKLLGSNKEHVYLFLFNDILLVTKKKGTTFQVRDYCQRNALHVESIDNPDKTRHIVPGTATGVPNILFLAMLANHENRQVEMVLSCKSESERTRWIDAIMPKHTSSESERIYDHWDCPQFHCVRKYIAQQPDELNLEESDVINVARKMADGWYEGERIRDGEKGWFPASHTEEINNSHVRARNLRLRYRLMRASQVYSQMELNKK